jgi:hypothetical protein
VALERLQLALDECKYVVESEADNVTRLRESLGRLETEAHALFLTLQGGSASEGGAGAGGSS